MGFLAVDDEVETSLVLLMLFLSFHSHFAGYVHGSLCNCCVVSRVLFVKCVHFPHKYVVVDAGHIAL